MRFLSVGIVVSALVCGRLALADRAHDRAAKRRELLEKQKAKPAPPVPAPGAVAGAQVVLDPLIAEAQQVAVTESDAFQSSACGEPLVICYTRDGALVDNEVWPTNARPGDKITVVVITNVASDQDATTVSFAGHKSDESLFPTDSDGGVAHDLNVSLDHNINYIPFSFTSDAIAGDSVELSIDFTRTDSNPKHTAHSSHRIDVDLGYSYFSVALLVAATYKADRHVFRDLSTVSDHAVDPGLALNVFPGGRQRGVIGYLRRCSIDQFLRCIANTVGVQVATSLDLTSATDRLYAGLVFEPIAGLALVGGVSLRKVDVVASTGGLPSIEPMDGSSPLDHRYVVRGYVGLTFTVDLLTTIAQAGTDIRKLATQ